jgi:hypothetical protein
LRSAVPAASMLFASLGMAAGVFERLRDRFVSPGFAMAAAVAAVAWLPHGLWSTDNVFLACWFTVIANAASIHAASAERVVRGVGVVCAVGVAGKAAPAIALALSINTGLWAGAVIAVAGAESDLLRAALWLLLVLPAAAVVRSPAAVTVKVLSSWLVAVALLEVVLHYLPVTPGYAADHLE